MNLSIRVLLVSSLLAMAACQKAEPPAPSAAVPAPQTVAAATVPAGPAPAWQTDRAAYPLLLTTAPAFSGELQGGGGQITKDKLKGHWTILAFWGLWSPDSLADATYIRALVSAADQDPDLDFLSIHIPPTPDRGAEPFGGFKSVGAWFKSQGGAWPTLVDADGKIAQAFKVTATPAYLLIGPDLTIEGYRTSLSATPDDGIKSVIKGYAEIRKHISAPGQ